LFLTFRRVAVERPGLYYPRMKIRAVVSGLALGGFGLAAAFASAAPGNQQYNTVKVTTAGVGGTQGAHTSVVHTHGSLPFTGMSLVWIVVAGVMLVLLGLALRRRGRRSTS
jgi:LPXTG-motif cell wall-anchored protein